MPHILAGEAAVEAHDGDGERKRVTETESDRETERERDRGASLRHCLGSVVFDLLPRRQQ